MENILSIYSDASFNFYHRNARIGYTMWVKQIKILEFFSDNIHMGDNYDSNHAELLSVLHALSYIEKNKKEIEYFKITHIRIYTDNQYVALGIKDLDLMDYIKNINKLNIFVNFIHKSRNNPRIKYVDKQLRFN